jgi:hypothetical protein
MVVQFNHTILYAHEASAKFLAEMLGLPAPARWGPFVVVKTDIMTADVVSTLRTRTGISLRSSPVPMAAAAGILEPTRTCRRHSDLAISSVIFFASPSTIMVLSR